MLLIQERINRRIHILRMGCLRLFRSGRFFQPVGGHERERGVRALRGPVRRRLVAERANPDGLRPCKSSRGRKRVRACLARYAAGQPWRCCCTRDTRARIQSGSSLSAGM